MYFLLWCSSFVSTWYFKTKVFFLKRDVSLFTFVHLYHDKICQIFFKLLAHRPTSFTIPSESVWNKLFWLNLSKRKALKVVLKGSIIETYNDLAHHCPSWIIRSVFWYQGWLQIYLKLAIRKCKWVQYKIIGINNVLYEIFYV